MASVATDFFDERTGRLTDYHGIGHETAEDRAAANER